VINHEKYLRVIRNNQDNVCSKDLNVPKCDFKLSNQNPNLMIQHTFNALTKRIKQIDCDKILNFNSLYFLHICYKIGNCRLTKRSFGENGHCKFSEQLTETHGQS
jgi:hypothetical protein